MEHLIDFVIVVTLVESIVLAIYHRRTGRGLAPGDFLPTLAAGLALMVALRAGVTGAGWGFVAASLLVAGLAHAADVRRRWQRC